MNLDDPVVAYVAETNHEAQMVQHFLENEGIAAFASEDNSLVGHWTFGSLPEVYRPEVWISRADVSRVAELLTEFERRKNERKAERHAGSVATVESHCENCERDPKFPVELFGTVQNCPYCGGFLDVGETDWSGDNEWDVDPEDSEDAYDNGED